MKKMEIFEIYRDSFEAREKIKLAISFRWVISIRSSNPCGFRTFIKGVVINNFYKHVGRMNEVSRFIRWISDFERSSRGSNKYFYKCTDGVEIELVIST